MTDHYTAAVEGQQAANEAFDHGTKMIAFANAQLNATLAVADELRAAAFMRTEAELDAETKAMFTVNAEDREHEQAAADEPEWTEIQTTYTLVVNAITEYIETHSTIVRLPIDIRPPVVQTRLAEYIAKALVGGESEQPEPAVEQVPLADWEREILEKTAKFPDVATSTSHAHRDREAVIRDALYEAIGDAADAAALARVTDDALISAGFGTSPLVARLASMAAPCQLVMDVLSQYGIHDDGPYGDQGRMNIAIAVAGAMTGTEFDDFDMRVDRVRAAIAATYNGQTDVLEIAADIVRALAEGRTR